MMNTHENVEKAMNIKLLSFEECPDEAYGASIVQYQVNDDFISFAFSDIPIEEILSDESKVSVQLYEKAEGFEMLPEWNQLSEKLRELLLQNPFDMTFIEYDFKEWNDQIADAVYDDAKQHHLHDVVQRDVDDCYLTVYAGAMGEVNWNGHEEYGKPCLEHRSKSSICLNQENAKESLTDKIQTAAAKAVEIKNPVNEKSQPEYSL